MANIDFAPDTEKTPDIAFTPDTPPPDQQATQPSRIPSAYIPPEAEKEVTAKFDEQHPFLGGLAQGVAQNLPQTPAQAEGMLFYTPVTTAVQDIYHAGTSLTDTIFGGKSIQEVSPGEKPFTEYTPADVGKFVGSVGGQIAMGALVGRGLVKPSLTESIFGKDKVAPEAPSLVPETPITDAATGVQDRQLLVQPERRFTLVPEPRPEVAPVQPLEQQVAELPAQRVIQTPEGDVPIADRGVTRTGIQAETQRIGGEPSATQERQIAEGNIAEHPGNGEGGTPATTGGGGGVESSTPIQPTTQEITPAVPQPEPPVKASDQPVVSRIANRFVDERVSSGELGEIAPGQGYSARELAARGLQMSPEEVTQHMSDLVNKTGDPIKQAAAVRAEEARLSQRSAEASRIAQANPNDVQAKINADNAFKDLTDFHKGPLARLKTIFHGTGEGLQGELPVDLSTYNGLREKWLKETGEAPPKHMEPQMRKTADQVKGALDAENGATKKLGDAIEESVSRRGKLPTPEEVADNIQGRMKVEPCLV